MKKVIVSEENTYDNEVFRSTMLQPFQFELEQIICVVMRAMRKKLHAFFYKQHQTEIGKKSNKH